MKGRTFVFFLLGAIVISTSSWGGRTSVHSKSFSPAQTRIVDVSYFYDELSPYGRWLQLDEFGWVWSPNGMAYGWRPYTNGYWVWTDWGWTWVSAWAWGWAPFHYGRWHHHSHHGWVWIPATVWGPAWVVWRHRPGWIGWAPLPPQVGWRAGFGLEYGAVDMDRLLGPHCYSFVEERQFSARSLNRHIQLESRNVTLLGGANRIIDYSLDGGHIVNHGVAVEQLERDTGQKIRRHRLVDADAGRRDHVRGDDVVVFRPKLEQKASDRTPRVTDPAPIDIRAEQRKLDKQQAREQAELDKQQRKEKQRLEDQIRIEQKQLRKEQQRLDEQKRIREKQERKSARRPDISPAKPQTIEDRQKTSPTRDAAVQQLEHQHQAENQALKEQRQRREQILQNRVEIQRRSQPPATNTPKPAKQRPSKPGKP